MRQAHPTVIWFRQDLRVQDHLALFTALSRSSMVYGLFILDKEDPVSQSRAGRWWLHYALLDLERNLRKLGVPLIIRRGPSLAILQDVIEQFSIKTLFWSRRYDPIHIHQDISIKKGLAHRTLKVRSFNNSAFFEPWDLEKAYKSPGRTKKFQEFELYCDHIQAQKLEPLRPLPAPLGLSPKDRDFLAERVSLLSPDGLTLDDLELRPMWPDWACSFDAFWTVSEAHALHMLHHLTQETGARDYESDALLPYRFWGQVGPRRLWYDFMHPQNAPTMKDTIPPALAPLLFQDYCWHNAYATGLDKSPANGFEMIHPTVKGWLTGLSGDLEIDAIMRSLWETGHLSPTDWKTGLAALRANEDIEAETLLPILLDSVVAPDASYFKSLLLLKEKHSA